MASKKCGRCQEDKDYALFNKNASHKDGLSTYCKTCLHVYIRKFKGTTRICALPECSKVFRPKRKNTMFCRAHCHDRAKELGIGVTIIELKNSPSKLPQKAFIGAEEEACVILQYLTERPWRKYRRKGSVSA